MRRLTYLIVTFMFPTAISAAPSPLAFSRPAHAVPPSCICRHPTTPSLLFAFGGIESRSKRVISSQRKSMSLVQICAQKSTHSTHHNGKTQNNVVALGKSLFNKPTEQNAAPTAKPILHLPRHIAFICDGNSRWAEEKSLPKSMGHAAGAERVMSVLKVLQKQSQWQEETLRRGNSNEGQCSQSTSRIEYCTLFAFSTENWSRPPSEISTIMKLMEQMAIQYRDTAIQEGNIQIEVLGDLDDKRIPEKTREELRRLENDTKQACKKKLEATKNMNCERMELNGNNILTICLAINYGGRADILSAAQKLAQSIASGEISPDNREGTFDESEISKRLSTSHMPDPDLIIRTGGEKRLSNFLLWNAAYAELYFSDLLWPDFDDEALEDALRWFGARNRRFGGRKEGSNL